jgi:outer membrane protein TolC
MKFKVLLMVLLVRLIFIGDVYPDVLNYEHVLSDAFRHSQKLLEAEIDKDIKTETMKEAKYLKYPELSLKIYSEQENDLAGDTGITSIGGTVLSDTSKFQNTAYVDLNYSLLDYGVRKRQVTITEMDMKAAQAIVQKTRMDVEKEVLDLYSSILKTTIEINYKKSILELMEQLNRIRKRSGDAGMIDRFTVMDREIDLEKIQSDLEALRFDRLTHLDDLSFYTGETYDATTLEVIPYAFEMKDHENLDYKKLPEYQYYAQQYQMKNEELEIERKKFYPNLYMRYSFYGSDRKDYYKSFGDLKEKNFTTGIYTSIPLMENFKRRHTLSRLRSEKLKAEVAMDEKYDELRILFEKLIKNYSHYQNDLKHKQKLLGLVKEKVEMMTRLTENKIVDLEKGLEQKITLINQEVDLEKQIVDGMSAIKYIMIQSKGAM